ncbi:recombinase family protein [Endozoicomonas acroporae]|uniref:recombinase family protein n=1 Tax=Endozoicomonas acroporae TaxID=1701104 RepID=UPI000C78056B|nr:recombinase family protein [Endozoicomonas acroporae]
MSGQKVGYIRVSSTSQNDERQLDDVELDEIFRDKCSGKDTKRPGLDDCLRHLRKGDTLHVHSLDRLARNLGDLQTMVEQLNAKGINVQFHKENLFFTGTDNPMQKLMLQMMGAFAEFERNLIRERQREGIEAAKARGVLIGSRPKLDDAVEQEMVARASRQGANKKALAEEYGVTRATLYNAIKRYQSKHTVNAES